jgi:hypothetical protein
MGISAPNRGILSLSLYLRPMRATLFVGIVMSDMGFGIGAPQSFSEGGSPNGGGWVQEQVRALNDLMDGKV